MILIHEALYDLVWVLNLFCRQAQTRMKPFEQAEEEEDQVRTRSNSASKTVTTRTTSGDGLPPFCSCRIADTDSSWSFEQISISYLFSRSKDLISKTWLAVIQIGHSSPTESRSIVTDRYELPADIEAAGGRRRRSSIRNWAKKFSFGNASDESSILTERGGARPLSFGGLQFTNNDTCSWVLCRNV